MARSRIQILGIAGTAIAVVAYGLGMVVSYPGRELSITVGMLAITLLVLGGVGGEER